MGEKLLLKKQKAIATRITEILAKREWSQRDLAQKAKLKDSYITRVIQAEANLTLRTISALERALGETLIVIP